MYCNADSLASSGREEEHTAGAIGYARALGLPELVRGSTSNNALAGRSACFCFIYVGCLETLDTTSSVENVVTKKQR